MQIINIGFLDDFIFNDGKSSIFQKKTKIDHENYIFVDLLYLFLYKSRIRSL